MRSQKSPASKRIESIRARLDRLGVEVDGTRDADELVRRKSLFECVSPIRHERLPTLIPSQSSRGNQGQVTVSIQKFRHRWTHGE